MHFLNGNSQLGAVTAVFIRKRFYIKSKVFDLPLCMHLVFKKLEGGQIVFTAPRKNVWQKDSLTLERQHPGLS